MGLTGTSQRSDRTDVSMFFEHVADRKELVDMYEGGVISPVRGLRVKTNIDIEYLRLREG